MPLNSRTLKTTHEITLPQVQALLETAGGMREKRSPAAELRPSDDSTNLADVFSQDGDFLCAVAVDDSGRLDIVG